MEFYRLWRNVPVPDFCPIQLGGIYTVRELATVDNGDGTTEAAIRLVEAFCTIPYSDQEGAFPLQCFRPARKPRRDVVADLKHAFGLSRGRQREVA